MLCKANVIYLCVLFWIIIAGHSVQHITPLSKLHSSQCLMLSSSLLMKSFDLTAYFHLDSREDT